MKKKIALLFWVLAIAIPGWSQGRDIAAILGYPQTIVYNAKIITVSEQPLAENYTTSGTLMTEDRVDIASRLTGFIRRVRLLNWSSREPGWNWA